jgi:trehalose 6-phosphate phosphatase
VTVPPPLLPIVVHPESSVVLVDFDGSLAPIVDDPDAARPLPESIAALRALAPLVATVAVVSGRSVDFLARAVPLDDVELVGLYGLERRVDDRVVVDPRAEEWIEPITRAADDAEAALPDLLVERKGRLAVTIHFRTTPDRARDARDVADALARRYGIAAPLRGRMAVELRPPVPVDKGTVVREYAAGAAVIAFAGDDAGDLAAFVALDALVATGAIDHAIRIGVRSAEAPDEILGGDVVVDGPRELASLFQDLAGAISARDA